MQRRPSALSGGQQQRVAVARALAAGPRLVLADELTANLDSDNAGALLDIMHRLSREQKTTFLFSTHDPRVMERAERIVTLHDGRYTAASSYHVRLLAQPLIHVSLKEGSPHGSVGVGYCNNRLQLVGKRETTETLAGFSRTSRIFRHPSHTA